MKHRQTKHKEEKLNGEIKRKMECTRDYLLIDIKAIHYYRTPSSVNTYFLDVE